MATKTRVDPYHSGSRMSRIEVCWVKSFSVWFWIIAKNLKGFWGTAWYPIKNGPTWSVTLILFRNILQQIRLGESNRNSVALSKI